MFRQLFCIKPTKGQNLKQGAFRGVASQAGACAKELTMMLRKLLASQEGDAADCIQMVRKLGEPIESLQVN